MPPDTHRSSEQLAREVVEAANARDFDRYGLCYAEDADTIYAGVPIRGRAALVKELGKQLEQFPNLATAIRRIVVDGPSVVMELDVTGTNTGPIRTPDRRVVPATGRAVAFQQVYWMETEDGQIARQRAYYDQLTVLGALGLL